MQTASSSKWFPLKIFLPRFDPFMDVEGFRSFHCNVMKQRDSRGKEQQKKNTGYRGEIN